jgi:hypothetical protein
MVLLGGVDQVEIISACLVIMLTSTQDRCTVCTERAIGSEIILAQLMVLLRDVGQVETCFRTFGDSVNLDAKIGAGFAPNVP